MKERRKSSKEPGEVGRKESVCWERGGGGGFGKKKKKAENKFRDRAMKKLWSREEKDRKGV